LATRHYTAGTSAASRRLLDKLHRSASGPFTVREAAAWLRLSSLEASRRLARWRAQGWVTRVRRGLYTPVPLGATAASWSADAWAVLARAFAPCYVGGWSAAEHWGLTEQLFTATVVFTTRDARPREGVLTSVQYVARRIPERRLFGTRRVWRDRVPVSVSDPARTLVDVLDDPRLGGGARHVAEMVRAYLSSDHRDDRVLLDYAHRLGNRTVFKRLGYLVEALGDRTQVVIGECQRNLSEGYSLLDPSGPHRGRLVRRWRLRVNATVARTR
jgi:predicted transcriptional regulator of viral defense system